MRRTLVAAFILFGIAVTISKWRQTGRNGSIAPYVGPEPEQQTQTADWIPSPRTVRSSFSPLAQVHSPLTPTNSFSEPIAVEWRGHWYPAEVVQVDGDRRLIRYTGYGDEWNEWIGPERIRPAESPQPEPALLMANEVPQLDPQPGDFVVKWGNRWWRAEALSQNGNQTLIRYLGYGAEWDEWVAPERAKIFTEADATPNAIDRIETSFPLDSDGIDILPSPSSAKLLVEWNGRWWPADVLDAQEGQYLIHYEGYGSNWDEWITIDRLRTAAQGSN